MLSRNQVQLIRIGDTYHNVANIAYVEFTEPVVEYEKKAITIYFTACANEGYMSWTLYGKEAEAIEVQLRSALNLVTAVHIELPLKDAPKVAPIDPLWTNEDAKELPL